MDRLWEEIQYVKGVGPQRSRDLHRLGVENVFDLLWLIPRAYFNRSRIDPIASLPLDVPVNIRGRVINTSQNRTGRGFHIFKAAVEDQSGVIVATWFNQPYLGNVIKTGQDIFLSGKVKDSYRIKELHVSEYEIMAGGDLDINVLPIYPLTGSLNQKILRKTLHGVLEQYLSHYPELLRPQIRNQLGFIGIDQAFQNIHFPENTEAYLKAKKRLAFEELLLFRLLLNKEKSWLELNQQYIIHQEKTELVNQVRQKLDFALTSAQEKVLLEIFRDMESAQVMNRLLQGDVGSGKTVVAALAMAKAVGSGYQSTLMAPTEILAEQHYNYLQRFFAETDIVIARLTGGISPGEKKLVLEAVSSGEINIVVGTHALIQEEVKFNNLGLVIIDEQHRFGVRQRALLSQKGQSPDVLVMTATPIPRTLALTVYGDLDISIINEMPPGRKPVKTRYLPRSYRQRAYDFARQQLIAGAQVYVICPLVEESEKQDLLDAVSLYEELSTTVYPNFRVGLLHGRMKSTEKEYIMQAFKGGQIQVLVATTVIEVGVDVSNATVIIIEHAERFGLSQLHQLRGRVGRGLRQSYCLLLGEARTNEAIRRFKAMEDSKDGFELANEDLNIRGPGDFWGVKQHGLDELKVASLIRDGDLIELSAKVAQMVEPELLESNLLSSYIANKFKKNQEIARN
ncbi:ATP-dependent DNA helicase RecG [Syntrophomonas zehnderi OL-4]|uniref:ATP-dependent DNA helicase RecG n=1 Tax=Syntrophomonas zehnderi OL-4 TaxID=690567 RepID=A0A0E3W3T9_9FIRM|nr:ATP-dependent DNA helicase RecG [Syntrophomonas zehnderi]CFY04771.1 ATP-dependent DNA helicase RecG [Syntrophomonas zehnderi OL-4]